MPTFEEAFERFPNAQNSTRVLLTNFYLAVVGITPKVLTFEFYTAILGVFLTIFHLTILTRKSMRTSSIMSIMISVAICDLISMLLAIASRDTVMSFEPQECTPPLTFFALKLYLIIHAIRDNVIRISTWLSVTMALIRYLVLKLASRPGGLHQVQRIPFGFTVFGVATSISTFLSLLFYLRSDVVVIGEWKPADNCSDAFPPQPLYEILPSDLFKAYNGLIHHVFMFLNGTFSKILPCLLFPILTGLLILELREAQKKRTNSDKNSTDRTTGLVIFMTVSFFIALLPSGIMTSLQAIYTDIGFLYMSSYVEFIFSALLTLNSTLHCFICFTMSTQYRKTVKNLSKKKEVIRTDKDPNTISFRSPN